MKKPVLPCLNNNGADANNKGADQPVHQFSLITTFVFGGLDTSIVSTLKTSGILLASVIRFPLILKFVSYLVKHR